MVFSSIFFVCIFLPVTLILYYLVPGRFKNLVLLLVSLVFYAWGEPVYVFLMMFSILFNYMAGILLGDLQRLKNPWRRKTVFIFTVIVNLAMLGFFKYTNFVMATLGGIFGFTVQMKAIALPIGISFYTFQILSYIIDVYWGKVRIQKNIINFGAYVTMFPQLIAGPIVRYEDIEYQLTHRKLDLGNLADGATWFIKGMCKKVLIANNIGALFDTLHAIDPAQRAAVTTWIMLAAYMFQIYFDFSGYSDMAVGLGKMLGFEFVQNFDHPFTAQSATEFWHRWHISLGTWFREYVYIPLGGNRVSTPKYIRNTMVVWFLTGLWHGADWQYVLWGLYFGVVLLLEKFLFLKWTEKLPRALKHFYGFTIVMFSWPIFSATSLTNIGENFKSGACGYGNAFIDSGTIYYLTTHLILFIICILCATPVVSNAFKSLCRKYGRGGEIAGAVCCCLAFLACMAFLVNSTYNPFLYFRF